MRTGILDEAHLPIARKGYQGIINRLKYDGKNVLIDSICVGTDVGDYTHYCARPTITNDCMASARS